MPRVNWEQVANLPVPIASIAEQQAIANFLDRETAVIDTLIAKKRELIERLQEKRTALISHTVTKGLDPTVPMKDSGVEWYGNIPQHWNIKRLGWLTSAIQDIDHKMPNAVDSGIPFLSAKDLLDDGTLNFTNDVKMISEEDFKKLSRKIIPRRGDIIYSRIGARLGKARIVETDQRSSYPRLRDQRIGSNEILKGKALDKQRSSILKPMRKILKSRRSVRSTR